MAPSSKSKKKDINHKTQRRHKDHIVKLLVRGKLSGHFSQHLFRKLPPRVCVPLKKIVSEEYLRAGHIFLGFTKCGRYVLSYTRDCGEDDDFSFYTYHLYWWEFNLHSKLKQVQYVRLFAGEEIYNDLYLTVCGWPNDQSKIVIFGFNSLLMNLLSAENYRDVYITIVSMPPPQSCTESNMLPSTTSIRNGSGEFLEHGYVLNSRYQVVYPFPTFQPAFQLKKDQVILLNTSYSLVACAISVCQDKAGPSSQILYTNRTSLSHQASASSSPAVTISSLPQDFLDRQPPQSNLPPAPSSSSLPDSQQPQSKLPPAPSSSSLPDRQQPQSTLTLTPPSSSQSQTNMRFRQYVAELLGLAQGGAGGVGKAGAQKPSELLVGNTQQEEQDCSKTIQKETLTCLPQMLVSGHSLMQSSEQTTSQASSSSSPSSPSAAPVASQEIDPSEPGYVNYSCLHYCFQPGVLEQNTGSDTGYQDDKVQLAFTVTDLKGRSLQLVSEPHDGRSVCVEQLTLDFEYLINEVIRKDAAWAPQFCSFSDYDVVILEVCPETNVVMISIGLLLLASPSENYRPNTYHSNLQVSWDLNTGVCCTVGVGDLTEVKGQTSGRVWSSYRKSCVNTLMKWLVPESSSRYINRMTNEGLHKGSSLQVLADSDRCTWIVL